MRLLFAGTPDVALPSLEALVASDHEVVGVLTRPPAPAGRGRGERSSPVHARVLELGIPVIAAARLGDPGVLDAIRELAPECCPVVAYGALITEEALAVPPHGWVNLHFSLLPRWRGAAPVQYAIRAGDERTGATTFRIDAGLDTGPVLLQESTPIGPRETSGELLGRLAVSGARLLVDTMDRLQAGSVAAIPQSDDGFVSAPRISVDEARIDWTRPGQEIDRLVRAMTPSPGAWTTLRGERVKVGPVTMLDTAALAPGHVLAERASVVVGTGDGDVSLGEVQPHGKRAMSAADWARGLRLDAGERFA
jgi:methionyl-tRNA formyltransferase